MSELRTRVNAISALIPNWSDEVQIEYAFQTSILQSHDGTEQREALRSSARNTVSMTAFIRDERMRRLLGDINSDMDAVVAVPMLWRTATVASVAAAVVNIPEQPFWAAAGGRVILWSDTQEEEAEILSVASDGSGGYDITLTSEPVGTFTAGDMLCCSLRGRMESGTQFTAPTSRVWSGEVTFNIDPTGDIQAVPTITPATFEGSDVFPGRPNWRDSPKITFDDFRDNLDFGRGMVTGYNPVAFVTQQHALTFTGTTRAKAEELIAFFLRCYGKQIAFWMPTDMQDIDVLSMEGGNIIVEGTEFRDSFEGSQVYNVVHANGQLNRVASYATTGELNTRLVMTDAWSTAPVAGDKLSWAPLWRFSTDKLIVEWATDSVAEMKMTIQTLPNEAP